MVGSGFDFVGYIKMSVSLASISGNVGLIFKILIELLSHEG
jgi:hypothetical protein